MGRLKKLSAAFAYACTILLVASLAAYGTSFNNSASLSSVRAMLNRVLFMQFNIYDYGATCIGSGHDDTAGIQAAINAASAAGGGTVYVPATTLNTVYCNITSSLTIPPSTGEILISIKGEKGVNLHGSKLIGNFSGYIINAPDGSGGQNISVISGLFISNSHAAGGGIFWGGAVSGEISDCAISAGLNGLNLNTTYNITVRNCQINGAGETAGIGVIATQSNIRDNSFTGWGTAVRAFNVGVVIEGNRFEVNMNAIVLGRNVTGVSEAMRGAIVSGNSGERNNLSVEIVSGSGIALTGNIWTGLWGPGLKISTMTWAAGSGGVVTVGTTGAHGKTGTFSCIIELSVPSGYVGVYTCTVTDTTHFTFPLASNPGTMTSPGTWAGIPQYGILFGNCTACSLTGENVTASTTLGAIHIGDVTGANIAFTGVNAGFWVMPTAYDKNWPAFSFTNSDNPSAAFPFLGLPASPVRGMQFDLTNCTIGSSGAWGGTVTDGGGGGVPCRAYYNGTNWTAMAK